MGADWVECTLGDFVSLQRGHDLPEHRRKPGRIPVMGSFGLTGFHSEPKVAGPGVTVGRSGASFGVVSYCPVDYWPLNTALYVTDFHGNDERFAYYFLGGIDFSGYNSGSAQPSLNRNFILPMPVTVPPLPEQHAIAAILGTLDDRIELNRKMNETLEAMARALFKSWFVDFDPVRAKAAGRQPAGMDAETASLFPDSFEDSELGRIPRGWRVAALPKVLEVNPRASLPKGTVAPYLDMKNMPCSSARATAVTSRPFNSGSKFVQGDTLVARITPCLENGKTAYVDFLGDGVVGTGSTEYIVLRRLPPLPQTYPYFLARTPEFRSFAISNMTGTSGRQRVPPDCLSHFSVVVSPGSIFGKFGKFADEVLSAMKQSDDESATLAAARDALLPRLLSGEIRIKDAEKFVEAAA